VLGVVLGSEIAVVAVGPEDVLAVRAIIRLARSWRLEEGMGLLDIEIEADTSRSPERINLGLETTVLRSIAGSYAFVCLGAGVCACSAGYFPLVGPVFSLSTWMIQLLPGVLPVTVNVTSDTGVSANGLSVLAPETVSRLAEHETIRVDDGRNVEVELIDERLHGSVGGVFGQELPSGVLRSHGGNPLPGVNISVDDNSGPRSLAPAAPDMDAGQDTSLDRGTDSDDFRLSRVTGLQVSKELEVVGIGMVCGEPCLAGDCSRSVYFLKVRRLHEPA
jgi:hypothetical protein